MADLVERLMGIHPTRPKIPVHGFQAILAEWADGTLTGAQAQAAIDSLSGEALAPTEVTEAQALLATVTSIAVPAAPTGTVNAAYANTQALRAAGKADRTRRAQKIDGVLLLADQAGVDEQTGAPLGVPGYRTATEVRAKLGI
jgi:hypothetical protein